MPVYQVDFNDNKSIVEARSKAAAIQHVIKENIKASTLSASDVAKAAAAGLPIEIATDRDVA